MQILSPAKVIAAAVIAAQRGSIEGKVGLEKISIIRRTQWKSARNTC